MWYGKPPRLFGEPVPVTEPAAGQDVAGPVMGWAADRVLEQDMGDVAGKPIDFVPLERLDVATLVNASVSEDGERLRIRVFLPGFSRESIHVDLEGAVLMVKAFPPGRDVPMERSFILSAEADLEGVAARYEDHTLEVTVPKRPLLSHPVKVAFEEV